MKYNLFVDGVSVEALLDKLGGVEGARRLLAGHVEVVIKDHIVSGKDPFVPDGWKVESHKDMGNTKFTRVGEKLFLDGKEVVPFLSSNQAEGKSITGDKLKKELEGKTVLTAKHLDYLREHPELIPDSWKVDEQGRTRYIFFWGTIYRDSGGDLYVRCLCWDGGPWDWSGRWLDCEWFVSYPAAVLAS